MTPSDVMFSRIIFGSEVVFALLGLAYSRLFGRRAKVMVARVVPRVFPIASAAFVGVALAFDLPLVAKVLLWMPAAVTVCAFLLGQVVARQIRLALKAKQKK
jgi:hypothetical protein